MESSDDNEDAQEPTHENEEGVVSDGSGTEYGREIDEEKRVEIDRSEKESQQEDVDENEEEGAGVDRNEELESDSKNTRSDDEFEDQEGVGNSNVGDNGEFEDSVEIDPRVSKYDRFKKVERSEYERVNEFLRKRTYITAREWAIARLCSDFRTETGVEMTLIGENLPELVPFMTDTYTPQAVNQARASFIDKVKKSGATFLYGSMSDFFTTEELDEMMYEVTETARFLLEVEGAEIPVEQEKEAEDRISKAMREIRESSKELREREDEKNGEEETGKHTCPDCGHTFED